MSQIWCRKRSMCPIISNGWPSGPTPTGSLHKRHCPALVGTCPSPNVVPWWAQDGETSSGSPPAAPSAASGGRFPWAGGPWNWDHARSGQNIQMGSSWSLASELLLFATGNSLFSVSLTYFLLTLRHYYVKSWKLVHKYFVPFLQSLVKPLYSNLKTCLVASTVLSPDYA